jgi:hypothetical protein
MLLLVQQAVILFKDVVQVIETILGVFKLPLDYGLILIDGVAAAPDPHLRTIAFGSGIIESVETLRMV